MIEPWQVWLADLDPSEGHEQGGIRPIVIISSALHLRSLNGRSVLMSPITSVPKRVTNRVRIRNPKGQDNWVITEQMRFISTTRFERTQPWWTLSPAEIDQVRRSLRHMVDF